jgi:hypothetical protein
LLLNAQLLTVTENIFQSYIECHSIFFGIRPIADTYWYLSAVPELLTLAKDRLEKAHEERPKCVE